MLRRLILLRRRFPSGIVRKKQLVSFANYYHLGEGCVMNGFKGVGSSRRARGWLVLGLLAPFSVSALAETVATQAAAEDTSLDLPALTIEGNRLYDMLPSEATGGYSVDAATVGTKTPAALKDIPSRSPYTPRTTSKTASSYTWMTWPSTPPACVP